MNEEDYIKNCPLCGCDGTGKTGQDNQSKMYYYVKCAGYRCGVQLRSETKVEAIRRWNKRYNHKNSSEI